MTKANVDLLQGTLDMLILKTLQLAPQHGWGVSRKPADGVEGRRERDDPVD